MVVRRGSAPRDDDAQWEIWIDIAPLVQEFAPQELAPDGDWVALRVSDPDGQPDGRANTEWRSYGRALAYTSPWYGGCTLSGTGSRSAALSGYGRLKRSLPRE